MTIKILSILLILAASLVLYKYSYGSDTNEINIQNSFVDSSKLMTTKITPVLNTKINTCENLIYCSTFQMAWNGICNDIFNGETVEIENAPDYLKTLNLLIDEPTNVSEDSYIKMAGFSKDGITEKFIKAVNDKFKIKIILPQIEKSSNNAILSFGFLLKNLLFEHEFERPPEPLYFQSGNMSIRMEHEMYNNRKSYIKDYPVEWFGINCFYKENPNHVILNKQIEIPYYNFTENDSYNG